MSALGTPKKVPRATKKLTDGTLRGYHDGDTSELYRHVRAGCRFDGADTTVIRLRLNHNHITDVSPLAQVLPETKITTLWLAGNQIADLSALAQVLPRTKITTLYLERNQITDVSGLAQVLPQTQIITLALSGNQIIDVSGLAQALPHTQITELGLERNQISDADIVEIQAVKKNKDGEDICVRI